MDRSAKLLKSVKDGDADFRALLDAAVDGIIAIDREGKVVEFNPAARRLFGYSAEEILGRNVSVLMPEPDRSQHDDYLHHYLDTQEKKIIGIGREVTGRRIHIPDASFCGRRRRRAFYRYRARSFCS